MTMVVAVFEELCVAHRAVADLVDSGFPRDVISVLVRDVRGSDTADRLRCRVLAGGPLGAALDALAHDEPGVVSALTRAGLQPAAARHFAGAVSEGGILVAVHAREEMVRDARDILDIYSAPMPRSAQDGRSTSADMPAG